MNVFYLKLIALTSMIIDHVGVVFFKDILIFRYIGRIAFPIYAFLVSEGCKHTKNFPKYLFRLFSFAIISETFFDLAFYGKSNLSDNNTIFTLFLASLIIYIINIIKKFKFEFKYFIISLILYFIIALILFLSEFTYLDYGLWGVCLTLTFYFSDTKYKAIIFSGILILLNGLTYGLFFLLTVGKIYNYNLSFNIMTLTSLIFIYLYNGEKGTDIKIANISFFYFAYPLHFLIIFIIKKFLYA